MIVEEVESAILDAARAENIHLTEFTVAPHISTDQGKSYHEWFIEFEKAPENLSAFAQKIDDNLRLKNVYYDDLVKGKYPRFSLQITTVQKNGFVDYMKSIGKLWTKQSGQVIQRPQDRRCIKNLYC